MSVRPTDIGQPPRVHAEDNQETSFVIECNRPCARLALDQREILQDSIDVPLFRDSQVEFLGTES